MDLPAEASVTRIFQTLFGNAPQQTPQKAPDGRASLAYGGLRLLYNRRSDKSPTHSFASWIMAAALLVAPGIPSAMAEEAKADAKLTAQPVKVVALGTSLTAGYGLEQGQGFVPQLQKALDEAGLSVMLENAGVSGDTSAGGLARLDWSLNDDVDAVIVELGSNDALRGFEPQQTRENLTAILDALKERGLPVLLTGMLAPPNLGEEYGEEFASIYPDLASEYDVLFYPFFLEGVAAEAALNQADGIHPNPDGVAVIVEAITPYAVQLVEHARKDNSS